MKVFSPHILVLFLVLSFTHSVSANKLLATRVVRGPYIQNATPTSVVVRWRTDQAVASTVKFGSTFGSYNLSATSAQATREHEVLIQGLTPHTKYYYYLSSDGTDVLSRQDPSYYFTTFPAPGTSTESVGFWVLGDQGKPGNDQDDVHERFLNSAFKDEMDLILMLGDNAYNKGSDEEFRLAVFETALDSVMRNTPVYSTVGNHEVRYDGAYSILTPETTPYYQIHNFPTQGEAGGWASGTESYYSWDYGNVHFISLNAEEEDLDSVSSSMWAWCENDLQQNIMDWTVVIVHQGPYTKGSHDSDTEDEHVGIRENFLPLLERYGVDLMLSGHSHTYERSMLLKGHYGKSETFDQAEHVLDDGYGRLPGSGHLTNDCAYEKSEPLNKNGAVYITAGTSSKITSKGNIDHPANKVNFRTFGSCYVEILENKMSFWYLESDGDIADYFQIFKDIEFDSVQTVSSSSVTLNASWPEGPYQWSTGATTRSIMANIDSDSLFTVQNISGSGPCLVDSFLVLYQAPSALGLAIKVALEGAYNKVSGVMEDYLRTSDKLLEKDPYGLSIRLDPALLERRGPDAVVDWMKLELRHAQDSSLVLEERAVLVQRDGDIMDPEGNTQIMFEDLGMDNFYLVLKHYNHLGVMTAGTINLSSNPLIDFMSAGTDVYSQGGQARKDIGGIQVLFAGDANGDGVVNAVDLNLSWRPQNGGVFIHGSTKADFDLNGVINAVDLNLYWRVNNSRIQQVPE